MIARASVRPRGKGIAPSLPASDRYKTPASQARLLRAREAMKTAAVEIGREEALRDTAAGALRKRAHEAGPPQRHAHLHAEVQGSQKSGAARYGHWKRHALTFDGLTARVPRPTCVGGKQE